MLKALARASLLLLSLAFPVLGHAGILSDAERDALTARVLKNFWGNARLSNGEFARPASELERHTIPITPALVRRAIDTGEISGLGEWCKLDWESNYLSMTKAARRNGLNDKQVAFMSFLHGAAQGQLFSVLSQQSACSEQQRNKVQQMLDRSKLKGLNDL